MEKKIDVRNLRISFRTNSGTVKAVRDISFSLEKGETLAIVGESGSGKSVTAKAVLGILAANSIVEGGEIIYDGQDLLKISEEEFNELRGHRISMIYQDPLSSLDPIMKIGKQMTEATLINGKVARKHGKKNFAAKMKQLDEAMKAAGVSSAEAEELTGQLNTILPAAAAKRVAHQTAREYAQSAVLSCEHLAVAVKKGEQKLIDEELGYIKEKLEGAKDPYLMEENAAYQQIVSGLPGTADQLEQLLNATLAQEQPDFTAMEEASLLGSVPAFRHDNVAAWNEEVRALAQPFAQKLHEKLRQALSFEFDQKSPKKAAAIEALSKALPQFQAGNLDISACKSSIKTLRTQVEEGIDRLTVVKDSGAYTFGSTMESSLARYTKGIPNNKKEERRVERATAKREKELARKGDAPKVIPAVLVDLKLTQDTMVRAITEVMTTYQSELDNRSTHDFDGDAERLLSWLEEQADKMETKVTDKLAYDKAIRIMEDVGIAEPRKRFDQYPFEFSGGMRQRIVIAIAVAANPDILICDEPTTALDVTIQAQILELINDLKKKRNLTVIFITHDLGVVANIADKVAVMYAGKLVEYGTADDIFYEPAHPYTWALLSSMPDLDTNERLESIPGTPPNMIYPPKGDAFAARNKYALAIDLEQEPPKFQISETHWAATWLLHPKAPKIEMPAIIQERIARMKELNKEAKQDGE
jgi:oligopeptide/dipeptide ABC transporter ATP-binding protein